MAEILSAQGHEIIFIDNNSNYAPLLDYYHSCKFKVVRLNRNLGSRAFWLSGIATSLNEEYVVTDPDLGIENIPVDWLEKLREGLTMYKTYKCGFSLDETLVPPENPAYLIDGICLDREKNGLGRWKNPLPGGFWNEPIDTTFALYNPRAVSPDFYSAVRSGRPYTARHWPWHIVLEKSQEPNALSVPLDDELVYYYKTAFDNSKGYFSTTKQRLVKMIEEFELRTINKPVEKA